MGFILGLSVGGVALDVILLVPIRTRFADLIFVNEDDIDEATAGHLTVIEQDFSMNTAVLLSIPSWPV